MAKLEDFDPFAGATAPVSSQAGKPDAEGAPQESPGTPEGAGAANGSAAPVNGRQKAPGARRGGNAGGGRAPAEAKPIVTAFDPEPETLDPAEEKRWLYWLGASAGKVAASRKRTRLDEAEWVSTVASARQAGVDESMILAAAFRARIEIPDLD